MFREDKGGNPEMVRESQRRRFAPVEDVDAVVAADAAWRKARFDLDQQLKAISAAQKPITAKKKAGENADAELAELEKLKLAKASLETAEAAAKLALDAALHKIGNLVHQSVPVSKDEKDNIIVKTWGEKRPKDGLKTHHELLSMIGGYDPQRGAGVVGHRGYYLTGPGVALNQALIAYALTFLKKKEYKMVQTPYMMRKDVMAKVAQLSEFDEALYKVAETDGEGDKYLIATSEQPIAAMHLGEWMEPGDLPIRYAGYSTCFRKEAGAHGRDTWGIFRVHQFEKIEQFVITSPETSWEMHETMLGYAEEFHQSLGLPYQVVNIVSGELNAAASKKYDVECYFPGMGDYRELVSCSNCTDFQARRMEIRYGVKKANETNKTYVHMLNSTLCATGRAICCILENGQTPEGIKIPEVLQPFIAPFIDDPTFIPFLKKQEPAPKK